MFCRYCGKSIAEESDFCTYCGKLLCKTSIDKSTEKDLTDLSTPCKVKNKFFTNNISFLVKASGYIALGVFLFFNIKMAPFYGGWKFLAYIVEGAIAIGLVVLTKRKIADSSYMPIKIFSLIFSVFIVLFSITLRIVYDAKVDMAEKDIPRSETILVAVSSDTEYYSYKSGVVYDPSTSIKINGASGPAKITFEKPTKLEITIKGDYSKQSINDTLTLHESDFINGRYTITKSAHLVGNISATVEVTLRRYCTFWEVIFY